MGKLIDLTGRRFGRLTVIGRDTSELAKNFYHPMWLCQCDCGMVTSVDGISLKKGSTKSCGCYRRERSKELMNRKWGK